jgi:hypothetical protein
MLDRTLVGVDQVLKSFDLDIGTRPAELEVEYAYQTPPESRMIPGSGKSRLITAPLLTVRGVKPASAEVAPRIERKSEVSMLRTQDCQRSETSKIGFSLLYSRESAESCMGAGGMTKKSATEQDGTVISLGSVGARDPMGQTSLPRFQLLDYLRKELLGHWDRLNSNHQQCHTRHNIHCPLAHLVASGSVTFPIKPRMIPCFDSSRMS